MAPSTTACARCRAVSRSPSTSTATVRAPRSRARRTPAAAARRRTSDVVSARGPSPATTMRRPSACAWVTCPDFPWNFSASSTRLSCPCAARSRRASRSGSFVSPTYRPTTRASAATCSSRFVLISIFTRSVLLYAPLEATTHPSCAMREQPLAARGAIEPRVERQKFDRRARRPKIQRRGELHGIVSPESVSLCQRPRPSDERVVHVDDVVHSPLAIQLPDRPSELDRRQPTLSAVACQRRARLRVCHSHGGHRLGGADPRHNRGRSRLFHVEFYRGAGIQVEDQSRCSATMADRSRRGRRDRTRGAFPGLPTPL